jgi:hypothetical protein
MPAAGIADAIDQRMIDKSLKQRIFVNNPSCGLSNSGCLVIVDSGDRT